jgi:hypothetical protein
MIPNKRSELAEWIRTKLGEPVIDALPLATKQVEDAIDDSIDYYQLFSGDVGHEENYLVVNTWNNPPMSATGMCALSGSPFTFCDPTIAAPFIQHRAEWQLPKSVIAVVEALPGGSGSIGGLTWLTTAPRQDIIERGLNAAENMSQAMWGNLGGGGPINNSTNNYTGMFFPGTLFSGGQYGTRGGVRGSGGGMDVVTMELGMQYMEMLNHRYRVSVHLEFHKASRKLRIQPPPKTMGAYVIRCWTRTAPEHLYDDYFIRHYALAVAMQQIGRTLSLYKGQKFVGGIELNGDFYYTEGTKQREGLEKDLLDNKFGDPPRAFFIG